MIKLFKAIELDEKYYNETQEPLGYVGVYVLKWGKTDEPTMGFTDPTIEEVEEYLAYLKSNK